MSSSQLSGATAPRRPVILSIVTVLMIIGGIVSIVTGIIVFALRNNADVRAEIDETPAAAGAIGIALIIAGVISILLAVALRRGSRIARSLVAIWEVVHIIVAIYALIRLDHATYLVSNIVTILFSLAVLYYLYGTQGSRDFFGDPAIR